MNKYPLIGISICAVVLLVLGSLSNVVGYQSAQSYGVNESPLFSLRTQKANNQLKSVISSQYLGKGKDALLQFPIRDNKTELLKKAIEIISKMDDKTFERFTELCIQRLRQNNTVSETNPNEISQILRQFRTKPETIINSFINRNNQNITSSNYYTICHWFPGCIPLTFLYNLIQIIVLIIALIYLSYTILSTCIISCSYPHCGP